MILFGILMSVLGFVLAFFSLAIATSPGVRMGIVMAGIILSAIGILGVLNSAFQKDAVWRKP